MMRRNGRIVSSCARERRLALESLEPRQMFSLSPGPSLGDLNDDGVINGQDIALIASNWLHTGPGPGDVNNDGVVNGLDISVVASHWLKTGVIPPAAVQDQPFSNVTVFQFADSDTQAVPTDFSAVVTLGDGANVTLTGTPGVYGQIVTDPSGRFNVQLSYTYHKELVNAPFSVTVSKPGEQSLSFADTVTVLTPVTQAQPEIRLDATQPATVGTRDGGALFHAAAQQYMTEPDNATLDSTFNNATQLTIEFQARQTTLDLNRNFLTRWNYGSNGTIGIATGQHSGFANEISVWFAAENGDVLGVAQTYNANIQPDVVEDIAVVFNAGQLQIYVNGIAQVVIVNQGSIPTTLAACTAPLDVGRWNGLGRYIDGSIANLNIWNVAKSADEIQSLNGDTIPYSQMTAAQKAGLVQSFALNQPSGPATDAVAGVQLQNPLGITREQIVTSWTGRGFMPTYFTPSPNGQAPQYVQSVPTMNGQAALSFNGLDDALKYAGQQLPNEQSGDVYIVVQFTGGGDHLGGDTLFSSSSDTTAVDYFFFASYDPDTTTGAAGAGTPYARLRFRDDTFQTDPRGSLIALQPGVTYVMHFWGLGTGTSYGFTINGKDDSTFYLTDPDPWYYSTVAGSWFGGVENRTNLTIGDFERQDGPQGFAAAYISEIDVFAGTKSQPVLPASVSASIVDYLMVKYGATRMGNDG